MIAHLKGNIEKIEKDKVVIDVSGVGYEVYMPATDISKLKEEEYVKLHIYTDIKEGYIALFGFLDVESLSIFEKLKKVGGIGSKTAQNIISNITTQELCLAIASEDYSMLSKVPGIGSKTAARIILELKDKVLKEMDSTIKVDGSRKKPSSNVTDAVLALQVLGYKMSQINEAIDSIETDLNTMNVQLIIKEILKNIGKK